MHGVLRGALEKRLLFSLDHMKPITIVTVVMIMTVMSLLGVSVYGVVYPHHPENQLQQTDVGGPVMFQ